MAFETEAGTKPGRAKTTVSQVKFDPLVDLSNEAMVDLVSNLEMVRDVPLQVTVELGRVDLLVNGRKIARGEVVVIGNNFGIKITQIIREELGANG